MWLKAFNEVSVVNISNMKMTSYKGVYSLEEEPLVLLGFEYCSNTKKIYTLTKSENSNSRTNLSIYDT